MRKGELMKCQLCGKETIRKSAVQKYCPDCSAKKDKERKAKWARTHYKGYGAQEAVRRKKAKESRKNLGAEISEHHRAVIVWPIEESEAEDLNRLVRVAVPFDYKYSKNAIWSMAAKRGHVYVRKEVAELRNRLTEAIRKAAADHPWYEGKVWIDIMVEKPDMRGDAVNVVSAVCDAVKEAIGIDDRWFCIRRLDWRVVKRNPRLFVGVGQAVTEHHRVCSTCGRILPLKTSFNRHKGTRLGYSRDCIECSRLLRKKRDKKDDGQVVHLEVDRLVGEEEKAEVEIIALEEGKT